MTVREALAFVQEHGIVLESARGPVPSLAEAIAGGPIRGSWWAHPRGNEIYAVLSGVRDAKPVLVCRLVAGKITYVHRRLWPALVRAAERFPPRNLAQLHEEHTVAGRHVTREVAFPRWVPAAVARRAARLSEADALAELGGWCA